MNKKVICICMLTILLSLFYVLFVKANIFIPMTFIVVSLWIYTIFKVLTELLLHDAITNACSVNWFVLVMILYNKYDEFMFSFIFCTFAIMRIIFVSQLVPNIIYFTAILLHIYILCNNVKKSVIVYNVLINNDNIKV